MIDKIEKKIIETLKELMVHNKYNGTYVIGEDNFKYLVAELVKLNLPVVMPELLCIDDEGYIQITKGLKYNIVRGDFDNYLIIDNYGDESWVEKDRFKKLTAQ